MKTYYQNGTTTDIEYIITNKNQFAVQIDTIKQHTVIFYPGDEIIRDVERELVNLFDKFQVLYFPDTDVYYRDLLLIPNGVFIGGQSSDSCISKEEYLRLRDEFDTSIIDLNRFIYVRDCQYLISTVQNLIQAVEYCFVQYYIQISQINLPEPEMLCETKTWSTSSEQSFQMIFFLETLFTKMYSILDMMVKIVYELEKPTEDFSSIKKLKCAELLWGDRKKLTVCNTTDSIFEDCQTIRMIESLRNEAVHNGSWEDRPKVYLQVDNNIIVERCMLFPDFEEGRLSSVKNRRHFFSTDTKVNDKLISVHDDFYCRLLFTLKHINSTF